MNKITIIGINDHQPNFSDEVKELINNASFFAGGKRHYELIKGLLPLGHGWFNIVVPISSLIDQLKRAKGTSVVFASGDPLFFGIANTIKRELPDFEIKVHSSFNALQILAHRFALPYGEFQTITLTGRSFAKFDKALIEGVEKMGILTDRKNTPQTIVRRMLDYGYNNYQMYYGEHLGGDKERILKLSLDDAIKLDFKHPNCFYLEKTNKHIPQKGIPETDFEPLNGRPRMITKMPIRLSTLALMQLERKTHLWDVGACTGSISIEAKLQHPHLKVSAFEIREESKGIIKCNAQKFQSPGIDLYSGDYLKVDKSKLNMCDAVFIGGYGGQLDAVLDDVKQYLQKDGILAFNSVSEKSKFGFINWCESNAFDLIHQTQIAVDAHNPITVLVAKK
ncbi:precorrin-6y C5,15-methyltransferase (decarboxylating) subunit CbiE [Carboxylicivirga sp. N1Y90]|uniref:precorrin-6y C5,15-methyltransferase (decarboxylating) subunit CbiE n=1 Tax=Carboxylicivirga fragile TaxID=3417571 RepID=UPI003D3577EA|nr:precorrin-6y C5,15-methyltransferase (decarboxylating) subunit CbiE [Marinilabiliaceae bacterium N1Y90]